MRDFRVLSCFFQSPTGSLPSTREAERIASHNFATATSSGSFGNTVFAQAGVAQDTMVQLMSKLTM